MSGRTVCGIRRRYPPNRSAYWNARDEPCTQAPIRLVVALTAAVLLASALIYTSFSASSEAMTPSKLRRAPRPAAPTS